uniref:Phlebovirus_G2 domain-containing protein n=1 Tax=Enterobius vermicularis TaxID=51028 RepID=A0A0N4VKV1_ENTVE
LFFFQLITIGFFSGSATVNSVQKVKLSCDRGVIRWIQPSGAAQISIAPRNGKPITICFKVNHLVEETVSIRLINLTPLWSHEIASKSIECFDSVSSLQLILEAKNSEKWTKPIIVQISYEVPIFGIKLKNEPQYCNQCNVKEIGDAFCRADFGCTLLNDNGESRIIIAQTLLGSTSVVCAPTISEFNSAASKLGAAAHCLWQMDSIQQNDQREIFSNKKITVYLLEKKAEEDRLSFVVWENCRYADMTRILVFLKTIVTPPLYAVFLKLEFDEMFLIVEESIVF